MDFFLKSDVEPDNYNLYCLLLVSFMTHLSLGALSFGFFDLVFFDRHWHWVTKQIRTSLASVLRGSPLWQICQTWFRSHALSEACRLVTITPHRCPPPLPPQRTQGDHHVPLWLCIYMLPTPAWAWPKEWERNCGVMIFYLACWYFYWSTVYIQ